MATMDPAIFDTPHFHWVDPYISIINTDINDESQPHEEEQDNAIYASKNEAIYQRVESHWKKQLGKKLVEDYMGIGLVDTVKKQYQLALFPRGYRLVVKKRQRGESKGQTDAYLIGRCQLPWRKCHKLKHCKGGHRQYRSPNEFLLHAAWLMSGATPGDCWCRYCDKSHSQTQINKKLKKDKNNIKRKIQDAIVKGQHIGRGLNALNIGVYTKHGRRNQSRSVGSRASSEARVGHMLQEAEE
ncbi:hypothetical protein FRC14_005512 [Serendipita sp. 396]|nr:hypothetical protein FRC14_005512 [Serendipita sp. 396]KAG8780379.1 hypothetical protein FRC15_009606 [Serendipita sp. 397]KAG9058299.1 hypothetical protein FS842_010669 [Serendipita sp. 407]